MGNGMNDQAEQMNDQASHREMVKAVDRLRAAEEALSSARDETLWLDQLRHKAMLRESAAMFDRDRARELVLLVAKLQAPDRSVGAATCEAPMESPRG